MSINFNVNVYKSAGSSSIKVFEFREGDIVSIPEGSFILYSEYVERFDHLEVWAAVPTESILSSESSAVDLSNPIHKIIKNNYLEEAEKAVEPPGVVSVNSNDLDFEPLVIFDLEDEEDEFIE